MSLHYQSIISVFLPVQEMKLARQDFPPNKVLWKKKKKRLFNTSVFYFFISSGVKDQLKTKEDNICVENINSLTS